MGVHGRTDTTATHTKNTRSIHPEVMTRSTATTSQKESAFRAAHVHIGGNIARTAAQDLRPRSIPKNIEEREKVKYNSSDFIFSGDIHKVPQEGNVRVKGRLREHHEYWVKIGANKTILNDIKVGYTIPFLSTPPPTFIDNNKSALENEEFVLEEIQKLLDTGRIVETKVIPYVVNPLTVSEGKDKKRLILDCRHINPHIFKEKCKFDDWKVMLEFVEQGGYMFKFDITQGYHHVEINPAHWCYLGFSWVINDVRRFFMFVVLAFGISSAPFYFTKLMRQLIKFWRKQSIKIACFIDDGAGFEKDFETAKKKSEFIKASLQSSGFVINEDKSIWVPTQEITWLGVKINLSSFCLFITQERIESIQKRIHETINALPYTTARQLAVLVGKIISTKIVLGDITRLKTRHLYRTIETAKQWDSRININEDRIICEIHFWSTNLVRFNYRYLKEYFIPQIFVTSDASSYGLSAIMGNNNSIAYRNLLSTEESNCSTERELKAIQHGLHSFVHNLENKCVLWETDNFAATLILKSGSNKDRLQLIAEDVFHTCKENNVSLKVRWIPRESNTIADHISRDFDYDDWSLSWNIFNSLTKLWGPFTIDRFADNFNTKLNRFNSKHFCPNTEQVDALSISWINENNYVVPPVYMVPIILKHMRKSHAFGVLVVPFWPSAAFWPFLVNEGAVFKDFIKDFRIFDNSVENCVYSGNHKGMEAILSRKTKFLACQVAF